MATGPLTKDTSTVALGLAQIQVGDSSDNIADINPALSSSDSLGAMADTRFMGETDFFRLESGYPLMEDDALPIREKAALECSFKEIIPVNVALAYGFDFGESPYDGMTVHSGEVPLGARIAPVFMRMEAEYTYPSGTDYMYIIFPRAQVLSSIEMNMGVEEAVAVPITFEAKRADSGITNGDAAWDSKPLGRIFWKSD